MLTQNETALIQKSWRTINKIDPDRVGDIFYSKLFFDNPELRKLFPENMEAQYQKFIDMMNAIIERLDRLDELKGDIVAMAKRHKNYGVKPSHYNLVGVALLWTLQKCLSSEWNEEIRSAWVNCYSILSGTMITIANK